MLARVVLFSALALIGLKLFAPQRLRALGRHIDRGVNLTLIGLALVYAVQLLVYFFSPR